MKQKNNLIQNITLHTMISHTSYKQNKTPLKHLEEQEPQNALLTLTTIVLPALL